MNDRVFLIRPDVGDVERRAVAAALDSGYIAPCGPQLDAFERKLGEISGRRHALALSSGTAAIDLLLDCLGVDASWTVLAPTLTYIATVAPSVRRGARLVLIDCDRTGNVDPRLVAETLKGLSRAAAKRALVLGVDLFGRCCDYRALARLCRRSGARLVIDAAESVGARANGRPAGSAGFAAIYSFNGNKTVTTSGGGALLTDSSVLARQARKLAQQGREPGRGYEFKTLGYGCRLSNILAGLGLGQLARLDEILGMKRRVAAAYAGFCARSDGAYAPLPAVPGESHWLNVILCRTKRLRDRALVRLEKTNVEARPAWKPLHLQPALAGVRVVGGEVAEDIAARGICLPSSAGLTAAELRRILSSLSDAARR